MLKQFADKQAKGGGAAPPSKSSSKKRKKKFSGRPSGSPKPAQRGGQVPPPTEFGSNETQVHTPSAAACDVLADTERLRRDCRRDDQNLRKAFNLRDVTPQAICPSVPLISN